MADVKYDEYGSKIINEEGAVSFKCPKCGDNDIVRSRKARELAKSYTCSKCGFTGP